MLERAEKCFRRSRHIVSHTLRLSSGCNLIDHASHGNQTRLVPCAWGVRRDDYRWRGGDGERDCAELLHGASAVAWALVFSPLPAWQELLPGSMGEMMGRQSELYLADYWLLALHYLVWTRRLPYPIKARWMRGDSIHDACFDFISELPTGLAETSLDALILFREAAIHAITPSAEQWRQDGPAHNTPAEPPVCREGRWCMAPHLKVLTPLIDSEADSPQPPSLPTGPDDPAGSAAVVPTPVAATPVVSSPVASAASDALELDNQSFTVRCGGNVCRFAARNKQLFALLERISLRPDRRISFDDLRSTGDVWDGLNVEDSTIRGAVARLRKALKQRGMESLARRIFTGSYQASRYVMLRAHEQEDD